MQADLSIHKKRRKVVVDQAKVTDLEGNPSAPGVLESAQNLSEKMKTLKEQFRTHQLKIMESFAEEQHAHDDIMSHNNPTTSSQPHRP